MTVVHARGKDAAESGMHSVGNAETPPHSGSSAHWQQRIPAMILERFHAARREVPAYRRFLRDSGVDADAIRDAQDIARIPPVSRANYLRVYPWADLCRSGALADESLVLTSTSGSTGQPCYVPRTSEVDAAYSELGRLFLDRSGLDKNQSTLVVICFGMGVWIGGLITYEAFHRVAQDGWPLSIITPGVNKKAIFDALNHVAPAYQQIVLCGYPPFIKDVIDEGPQHGIDWQAWDVRIVCAAEAFSEAFRDYLLRKTRTQDPYRSVMNIYGSAELGAMATETPLCVLLRRLAVANAALYASLFSDARRLPTLAQFVPDFVSFEASGQGALYATGGNPLPFVRYDIGDQGGVFTYADALRHCRDAGIDFAAEARRADIADTLTELPFVYVYERADLSTNYYGIKIHPEHIKLAVLRPEFEEYLSGRFTMTTEHDEDYNEYLEINIELRREIEQGMLPVTMLVDAIMDSLRANSSEYSHHSDAMPEKSCPRIVCWSHEHPKYFAPGVKQQWVRRADD